MKAMLLKKISDLNKESSPLVLEDIKRPKPKNKEILIKISRCGVCHTELDEIEGRTKPPILPVVLGHEIVGYVEEVGKNVSRHKLGDRVGVGWIYSACGKCEYCKRNEENLCANFQATGRDADGGYQQYMKISEDFAFSIPEYLKDSEAAPLLCAGAIGYRSMRLTQIQDGDSIGLTGFGGSAHLVLKMVKHKFPNSDIYVFARNKNERNFSLELGAKWAGDTTDLAPKVLNTIIDTTPAWKPVVEAMKNLKSGGRLVINAIRKEDHDKNYLTHLNYEKDLWMEKEIKSVANVTRRDISEFLNLCSEIRIKPEYQEYKLEDANKALLELKKGNIKGSKVLVVQS